MFSLVCIYASIPTKELPEIEKLIISTYNYILENLLTKNYSLATGTCGNLFALKYANKTVASLDPELASKAMKMIRKITLGDIFASTDFSKTFLHPSLFTGIAGLPVTLMYLIDDDQNILNILNLE